jgi:hypothetical protein
MNRNARLPTTRNRTRADEVAKMSTRKSIVGKLVGRVEEVSAGNFAVLVTCNGKPYGAMPL